MIIKEVYKIHKDDTSIEILPFGVWNLQQGLDVTDLLIWDRRVNMKGVKFR